MSFAAEVKKELAAILPPAPHCRMVSAAVLLQNTAVFEEDASGEPRMRFVMPRSAAAAKCFTLLRKTSNINEKLLSGDSERAKEIAEKYGFTDADGRLLSSTHTVPRQMLRNACCRRSYLRESFLSCGRINDPRGEYHLEFSCADEAQAAQLLEVLASFGIAAKQRRRGKSCAVYVQDSAAIANILSLMGAHASLMEMENSLILKEMRGTINRRVNCETANLEKTVSAAQKQIEAIRELERRGILKTLPESLQQIARLRTMMPDASLKEIGDALTPPVGKSGVNHRLRKLCSLAEGEP
ncbi:MAG: DNA-binding protein WhiA [Lachnospiraceae bacterium]|nr:DNA-binding protein WhiA [Lachnospiraceae bacterium]